LRPLWQKHKHQLNVVRINRNEEKLYVDIPFCEKHWTEGKELREEKISRLFIKKEQA
jgi:hypothetical protein